MNVIKIIVNCIIIMALIITSIGCISASAQQNTKTEFAAQFLTKLGVFEKDEDFTKTVTRAEFVRYLLKAQNINLDDVKVGESQFNDVKADSKYAAYINRAYEIGILSGNNSSAMKPEENITYEQVVKLVVCALGYEIKAEINGGYPSGYLTTFNSLGLSMPKGSGDTFTKNEIADLFLDVMQTSMLQQTTYGNNEKYSYDNNENFLSRYFDIYKADGVVTGINGKNVYASDFAKINEIEIDRRKFDLDVIDQTELLGLNCVYFYEMADGAERGIVKGIYQNKNDVVSVNYKDITGFSGGKFGYFDNGVVQSINVDVTKVNLVYNGRAYIDFDNSVFMPEYGDVTFIDNNNDGNYEIVIVEDKTIIVVSAYDKDKNVVYDIDAKVYDFEAEGSVILNISGDLSKIKKYDVITYAKSKDGECINAVICTEKLEGFVSEVSEEGIEFEGKFYEFVPSFKDTAGSLLDVRVSLSLDADGRVAYANFTAGTGKSYGYVMDFMLPRALSDKMEIRLLTQSGDFKVFKVADSVQLDGETYKKGNDKIAQALKTNREGIVKDYIVRQLLIYNTNSDGEISFIDTAHTKGANEYEDSLKMEFGRKDRAYRYFARQFATDFNIVDNKTIVFNVPKPEATATDISSLSDDDYSVKNQTVFSNGYSYETEAYAVSDAGTCMVLVNFVAVTDEQTVNDDSPLALVDKITSVVDSDELNTQKLYALIDGKKVELIAESPNVLVKKVISGSGNEIEVPLKQGDIIRYVLNNKGRIVKVVCDYDTEHPQYNFHVGGFNGTYVGIVGKVYAKDNVNIRIAQLDEFGNADFTNTNNLLVFAASKGKVYRYDKYKGQDGQVSISAMSEILDYKNSGSAASFVYIHTRYEDIREVIILNLEQ